MVFRLPKWSIAHGRSFGKSSRGGYRGGILVLDPVMAWGSTASMGPKQLLDSIDRASRAKVTFETQRDLWERLSCRCQALMLALSPQELCRALFGFYRARCSDAELLSAACDALLSEKDTDLDDPSHLDDTADIVCDVHRLGTHTSMSPNDVAMLLKAFSKHGYKDNLHAIDLLLNRARQSLPYAAVTDISQLLAAIVRLGLEDRFGGGVDEAACDNPPAPHPGLLNQLFGHARRGLFDRFTPASDVTNLCIAVCKLPATEQGSQLLLEVASFHLRNDFVKNLAPGDVLRRLQAIVTANGITGPIGRRLGKHVPKNTVNI